MEAVHNTSIECNRYSQHRRDAHRCARSGFTRRDGLMLPTGVVRVVLPMEARLRISNAAADSSRSPIIDPYKVAYTASDEPMFRAHRFVSRSVDPAPLGPFLAPYST